MDGGKIDQEYLDELDLLYRSGNLPSMLYEVYKSLPKKKDGTLNMKFENKCCYAFVKKCKEENIKLSSYKCEEKKDVKRKGEGKEETRSKKDENIGGSVENEKKKRINEIMNQISELLNELKIINNN